MKDPVFTSPDDDLNNLEVIDRILESGSPEELEKLRLHHNLTHEQLDLIAHYAKMRKRVVDQNWDDVIERERNNPKATPDEYKMGAYVEIIEPQVRDAVLLLRKKGYNTYESGFYGDNLQLISTEEDSFLSYSPSLNLKKYLKEKNIEIKVEPNSVLLYFGDKVNLETIKDVWDRVADDIPDLGHEAEPCTLQLANDFREKQTTI